MAKDNPGDILTCDWNPVIGCERHSEGCRNCWFLGCILPWQKRLGRVPAGMEPDEVHAFPGRLCEAALRPRGGIVGVVQHGDLFRDRVPDELIDEVLSIVDRVAPAKRRPTRYLLWTKRAGRMADHLGRRYPRGLPDYLAAAVSAEDQASADERFPALARVRGTRIAVLEPLLGPVALGRHLPVEWVVVGSETGTGARRLDPRWAAAIRDEAKARGIPFFVKQLGTSHRASLRLLEGREWNEFPPGFVK